jgi:hypothetical protein
VIVNRLLGAISIVFASLHFVYGQTPSAATSIVTVSFTIIPVNGTSTITVQLRDGSGNNITTGGASVTFATPSAGSIGTVTDNGNGTYTAVFTASPSAGSITITPKLSGLDFTKTVVITVGNGHFLKSNPAGTSTNTTGYSTTGGLALVLGLDAEYLVVGEGGGGFAHASSNTSAGLQGGGRSIFGISELHDL